LGLSTSILKNDRSQTSGVIAIFSDLTQVKALEAKARTADRLAAVGELSASIAHEIRNPLAAISGSVELLKAELDLDGENARLMELIVKESTRLNKTLTDFLSYARVDRFSRTKVDLCHVVTDVVEILHHHQSYHRGIQVVFETDCAVSYIVGDEDLTKQLLLNLVVNACEAIGSAPGTVLFRLYQRPSDDTVCLEVVDTGPGIAAENQRRLFQPFFSTKKKGTGLGLAICHRICAALGSQISFVSESGVGTTFLISFPAFSAVNCDQTATRTRASTPSI
jgi:signal transduction histidine kinase